MKFRIVGANRNTGEDVKMVIEAADQKAAEQWATDNGIVWSEVAPHSTPPMPPAAAIGGSRGAAAPTRVPPVTIRGSHQPAHAATAVNIPQGGVAVMHQTIVAPHKGVSGFGIAALILGIIAAIICWVPFVGLLSIPVAAIGLLLGIVGFLVSVIGRRSGIGMSVAGSFICVLAVVVAVVSTGGTTKGIADALNADMKTRNATNQTAVGPAPIESNPSAEGSPTSHASTSTQHATVQPNTSSNSTKEPTQPASEWVVADRAVRQGDVEVKVIAARVGIVPIKSDFGEEL